MSAHTVHEKSPIAASDTLPPSENDVVVGTVDETHVPQPENWFGRLSERLEALAGLETRGIERVPDEGRRGKVTAKTYLEIFCMWFGINCTSNAVNIGILGPVVFGLGFTDSMLLVTFGTLLGAACAGYLGTFGPQSGCRTMVVSRFAMGWWPSRLAVLLNLVIGLGYGVVNCLTAGLTLQAVNGHGMSAAVGIVISALMTWVIAVFGYKWFKQYEKFCWIPQLVVFLILIGCSGPDWGVDAPSYGSGATLSGDRVSFFFIAMSAPLSWASYTCDYYVYYPKSTSKVGIFLATTFGIACAKIIVLSIGIGLATGLATVPAWSAAFKESNGALVVAGLAPLGTFGKFCGVILALGLVANQVPGAYSCSFNFQLLGSPLGKVPRFIWCTVSVIIYAVCAVAGRQHLLAIFNDFLALIGYWTIIWVVLIAEEQVLFRRKRGWNWEAWNDRSQLPIGIAALVAFLIGWAGAIVCMDETYYVGPIAKMIGEYGADLGIPVSASWTALVFPPMRYFELKYVGR